MDLSCALWSQAGSRWTHFFVVQHGNVWSIRVDCIVDCWLWLIVFFVWFLVYILIDKRRIYVLFRDICGCLFCLQLVLGSPENWFGDYGLNYRGTQIKFGVSEAFRAKTNDYMFHPFGVYIETPFFLRFAGFWSIVVSNVESSKHYIYSVLSKFENSQCQCRICCVLERFLLFLVILKRLVCLT